MTGLRAECGNMKTHQKVGKRMKFDKVRCNTFGNKNTEIDVSEGTKINSFSNFAEFSRLLSVLN